jgi:hypothetical protein
MDSEKQESVPTESVTEKPAYNVVADIQTAFQLPEEKQEVIKRLVEMFVEQLFLHAIPFPLYISLEQKDGRINPDPAGREQPQSS